MKKIILLFVLVMLGVIGGIVFSAMQEKWAIFVPLVICFPVCILVFIFTLIIIAKRKRELLLKTGSSAVAKIISVSETGVRINNKPRMALHVEVKPHSGLPFEAKVYVLVSWSQPNNYVPGTMLNVMYDPNNTKNIIIESIAKNDLHNEQLVEKHKLEIKPLICPTCGGQIKVNDFLTQEEITHCNYCGTALDLR